MSRQTSVGRESNKKKLNREQDYVLTTFGKRCLGSKVKMSAFRAELSVDERHDKNRKRDRTY